MFLGFFLFIFLLFLVVVDNGLRCKAVVSVRGGEGGRRRRRDRRGEGEKTTRTVFQWKTCCMGRK